MSELYGKYKDKPIAFEYKLTSTARILLIEPDEEDNDCSYIICTVDTRLPHICDFTKGIVKINWKGDPCIFIKGIRIDLAKENIV